MFLWLILSKWILGNSSEILSIKNISCETLGSLKEFLLSDGYRIREVLAPKQEIPENIKNFDAIFILGGPMSVNDDYAYLKKEKQLILNSIKLGIPILGVCLGSQLIANSCGGKVYPGSKKEIGWSYVDITDEGKKSLFKNIFDKTIEVFQWHGDTFTVPENANVLSSSSLYTQAFKYKTAYGIQFHLEVTESMISDWIEKYQKEITSENLDKQELIFNVNKKVGELKKYSKIVYKNFMSMAG
jgi:GMP synthase-like glutamine amidotransferase